MTPAEISRFFAGMDTVRQHHGIAELTEITLKTGK